MHTKSGGRQLPLRVALLGFGTVGASVAKILVERPELANRIQLTHIFNRGVERKRALACGKRLVLELLQLRGDETLGVLERLATVVIERCVARLRAADLDVVAVHAVVADVQCGQAAAFALARLEAHEIIAGACG